MSSDNADKRNEHFEEECYALLYGDAASWNKRVNEVWRNDGTSSLPVINQYVRIMNWLDIEGQDLLRMDETPYDLMGRLSRDGDMDGGDEWNLLTNYDEYNVEWYGLGSAFYGAPACGAYYPQLFYDRWIPTDVVPRDELDPRMGFGTSTPTATPFPVEFRGPDRNLLVPFQSE